MRKSDVLDQIARLVGDESSEFKADVLTHVFDFVLLELAAEEAISLLTKQSSFAFNAAGCVVENNLLKVTLATVLNLDENHAVDQVQQLVVPAWGVPNLLTKTPDWQFEQQWLGNYTTIPGRPLYWRVYPNPAFLQLWPAPDAEHASAVVLMTWRDSPTFLGPNDPIAEILPPDLPTIMAGCYRYAVQFSDDTLQDAFKRFSMFDWTAGVFRMKSRISKAMHAGGGMRAKYNDW